VAVISQNSHSNLLPIDLSTARSAGERKDLREISTAKVKQQESAEMRIFVLRFNKKRVN